MTGPSTNEIYAGRPARVMATQVGRVVSDRGVGETMVEKIEDFARENPISFGLYAMGIGFVLGWRLKPW